LPEPISRDPVKAEKARKRVGVFGLLTLAAIGVLAPPAAEQAEARGRSGSGGRLGQILRTEGSGYAQRRIFENMRREEAVLIHQLQQANEDLDRAKLEYARARTAVNSANAERAERGTYRAAERLRMHREKMGTIAVYVNRGAKEARQW
jgi:hypothetical protein